MSEASGEPPGLSIRKTMALMSASSAASRRAREIVVEARTGSPALEVFPSPCTTEPVPYTSAKVATGEKPTLRGSTAA